MVYGKVSPYSTTPFPGRDVSHTIVIVVCVANCRIGLTTNRCVCSSFGSKLVSWVPGMNSSVTCCGEIARPSTRASSIVIADGAKRPPGPPARVAAMAYAAVGA